LKIRNTEKALQYGSYEKLERQNDMILFTRTYKGEKISVIINFGKEQSVNIPEGAKVLMGGSQLKKNEFLIYKKNHQPKSEGFKYD
jgi:trehalose-6-phosphate hydrolase